VSANTPQACVEDFTAALVARDMAAALALLTDDVVFFYSNGSTITGKDAFAALMRASWAVVEDYEYSSGGATWIAETEAAAAVVYSFAWSGKARGAEVSGSGRATRVLRKEPGAGWRVAHEHLSSAQRPGAP
jgi:ketosteroid isomerase-like protein